MTKNEVMAARMRDIEANSAVLTLGGLSVTVQVKGKAVKPAPKLKLVQVKAWHVLDIEQAPAGARVKANEIRRRALGAGIPANKLTLEIISRVMKGQLVYAKQLADAA